jgi:radical SAM-linked protein
MSILRCKFTKQDDMIYTSHLDLQRLLQRAFRRADISISHSQGFNPHPKISYGNALALGTESQGEYLDLELEEKIDENEFLERINNTLPKGINFIKAEYISKDVTSLSSSIEYGEYIFKIELERPLSKEYIKSKIADIRSSDEIIVSKKNKKGKIVDVDIRPMIRYLDLVDLSESELILTATIATGSKANLNTNIFIPMILETLNIDIEPIDVDIIRRDLYMFIDGDLVCPL